MNIAIIPARGGSKRIPRKNIKLFHGLPVIAYAIKTAKECGIFTEVFVSTDDNEIAEIAHTFGAIVPWMRPKELSDDFATTVNVMQDAVKKLDANLHNLENACCIYPTTPLLRPRFLLEGLTMLKSGNWDYVITASAVSAPPERFFSLGENNEIKMRFPEHEITRTQDFLPTYHDAGQFYWGKKSAWESGLPLFTSASTILEIPRETVVDLDTPEDWHYAESLFKVKKGE
jgi:N-acylneuraminate cytidylyltransferase